MKRKFQSSNHRGMTLVEMLVALGVLSVLLMLTGQWVTFSLLQQRLADQQRQALESAANLLERTSSQPWTSLTSEQLQPLAESIAQDMDREQWQATLTVQEVPPGKNDPPGLQCRAIRAVVKHRTNSLLYAELTTLRHHLEETKP